VTAVAIIPARGGSKRIPRKNIRLFHGEPIISYAIRAALESGVFAEVMVSTDDEEIADIARKRGAQVPFLRSAASSGDRATTLDVLVEVLDSYRRLGRHFDKLCCLYPTAVLALPEALRAGVTRLQAEPAAECVLPVVAYSYPIQRALLLRHGRLEMAQPEHAQARTQDLEPTYHDAGQWYWIRARALGDPAFRILGPASVPVVVGSLVTQDIDTEEDWAMAEAKFELLQRQRAR
jgi:N-acylneuraminate cytidylyltransferase